MCLRSVDTEQSRATVAVVWQLGIAADQRPDIPNAAVRRSAEIASCAPETRGAFPSSLHASQRDSAVLKRRIPPLPLLFLPLLLRLFSPHRGRWQLHSRGMARIFWRGQPGVKPQLIRPRIHPCWGALEQESFSKSAVSSDESCTLRKQKDHFPWEMTNQSHYYPINMMTEITFQTHACSVSPGSEKEMSCMILTAAGAR